MCWVEPIEALRVVEGELDDDVVRQGEVVMDSAASPGPEGVYRRLTDEETFAFAPEEPRPVFLHDSHEANIVKWMEPLQHIRHEAAAAERVRQAVFDLVESRVQADGVFSASAVVTSTEKVGGAMHVIGRCLVVRPTG
jgi:hypothetical protein